MQSHPIFTDEELDAIVQFHNKTNFYPSSNWSRFGSQVVYADGFCSPTTRELESTWASYYHSRMQVAS